ncbi:GOLPH3/VPS74 family protein [Amycolatopsis sp.]|uniref:GOLPH3/VPS74 family protein n=1 Tax=Amycolatopsis sp. TaxID=37632 RepID=UPI002BE5A00C|nr:GPP34 family phosphoprotein [Amycolatopsis sp.]HVV14775.1 GPP34 family phosphoprotein [Amycolatopsis sp.]
MKQPETLPATMYLLAFDPRRGKLTARGELGLLLRAAALADLVLNGQLKDDAGKAAVAGPAPADPVLRAVFEEISQAPPRSWRRWVSRNERGIVPAVRDQLAEARVIRTERVRVLGLLPHTRVTVRDTRAARQVAEQVGRAIRGGQSAERVEGPVAALAALAGAGQLRVVAGARDRRQYRARLQELGSAIEPVPAALRRAVTTKHAAVASGG